MPIHPEAEFIRFSEKFSKTNFRLGNGESSFMTLVTDGPVVAAEFVRDWLGEFPLLMLRQGIQIRLQRVAVECDCKESTTETQRHGDTAG